MSESKHNKCSFTSVSRATVATQKPTTVLQIMSQSPSGSYSSSNPRPLKLLRMADFSNSKQNLMRGTGAGAEACLAPSLALRLRRCSAEGALAMAPAASSCRLNTGRCDLGQCERRGEKTQPPRLAQVCRKRVLSAFAPRRALLATANRMSCWERGGAGLQ